MEHRVSLIQEDMEEQGEKRKRVDDEMLLEFALSRAEFFTQPRPQNSHFFFSLSLSTTKIPITAPEEVLQIKHLRNYFKPR